MNQLKQDGVFLVGIKNQQRALKWFEKEVFLLETPSLKFPLWRKLCFLSIFGYVSTGG